jgi:hypothetical protein
MERQQPDIWENSQKMLKLKGYSVVDVTYHDWGLGSARAPVSTGEPVL